MTGAADDLSARMRRLGGVVSAGHARAVAEIFTPRHAPGPWEDVEVTRDLVYGPDERHRLDLFRRRSTSARTTAVPVLAFVHGGNFVAGDRHVAGSPFYDNVGVWAARAGYLGVTLSYRLAPRHRHPSGSDDIQSALGHLREQAAQWGGDPEQVILVGASAGATHVASAVARAAVDGGAPLPAGVALLSGMYDLGEFAATDVLEPYYGDDPRTWARASPVDGIATSGVPVLVAISEHDPPTFHHQAELLAGALRARRGRLPHLVYLAGHNHFSEVLHLGTADSLLGDQLRRFVDSCVEEAVARRS